MKCAFEECHNEARQKFCSTRCRYLWRYRAHREVRKQQIYASRARTKYTDTWKKSSAGHEFAFRPDAWTHCNHCGYRFKQHAGVVDGQDVIQHKALHSAQPMRF